MPSTNRLQSLRSLRFANLDGSFATAFATLTSGAFLVGYMKQLGANDFWIGLLAAVGYGGYKFFKAWKHHELAGENWWLTLLATLVAAGMAFLAVKWLLRYVQTHNFTVFGWYRIGLGILILAVLW